MNRIVKIGMDVHSTNYTLCAMEPVLDGEDRIFANIQVTPDYKNVLQFIENLKNKLGPDDSYSIECGYEAGCLGYSLYNQLTSAGVKCIILAPTTNAVHVPTDKDDSVKEYLRMRDDHKLALKKIKQQINAFCIRHGYFYPGTKWTIKHLQWLRELALEDLFREVLDEYLASYDEQTAKIERFDKRIEELAADPAYKDNVRKLGCLLGIKVHTALSLIVETGDFSRFKKGSTYAAFLGLAPGESSSGAHINRTGISKAGNTHLRRLLIEGAKGICKGQVGHKSKELRSRQAGNSAAVIAYADRGNTRMRSKYYRMMRHGKKKNVAVAATARELACFVWGIMTNNMEPRTSGKKAA